VFLRGFFVIAGETRRKDVREVHLVSKKAAEAKKGDVNDKKEKGLGVGMGPWGRGGDKVGRDRR
jgi:hypothetical protein